MRVLVLEDEYMIAKGLSLILEAHGVAVVGPFASVAEAREAAAGAPIDGAFLDVDLGGVPSFEVADALRARGVPVCFLTGYAARKVPPRLADQRRLTKPFSAREIAGELARFGAEPSGPAPRPT